MKNKRMDLEYIRDLLYVNTCADFKIEDSGDVVSGIVKPLETYICCIEDGDEYVFIGEVIGDGNECDRDLLEKTIQVYAGLPTHWNLETVVSEEGNPKVIMVLDFDESTDPGSIGDAISVFTCRLTSISKMISSMT